MRAPGDSEDDYAYFRVPKTWFESKLIAPRMCGIHTYADL
jgi:hypothetical protein